jgi:hypothetical protein
MKNANIFRILWLDAFLCRLKVFNDPNKGEKILSKN